MVHGEEVGEGVEAVLKVEQRTGSLEARRQEGGRRGNEGQALAAMATRRRRGFGGKHVLLTLRCICASPPRGSPDL
jgi:hypothetical protein